MNNVLKNVLVKNKNQSLPLKNCNGTILKWLRKPSAGYKKDIGRFIVTFNKNECCWKEILQRCLFSQQVKITHNQGCVRLTVFRDRNTWNMSLKSFVFLEIHVKIIKHLLKRYFKHISIILAASKHAKHTVFIITPRILIPE